MTSDDIVQPAGAKRDSAGAAPSSVTEAPADGTMAPIVRLMTSIVGWVVGVFILICAGILGFAAPDYPPSLVMAAVVALAGVVVLPPVVNAARRAAPMLGSLWAPPLVFVLLLVSANPLSKLVAPQGAARQAYVARSLAAADQALKAHDPDEADRRMTIAREDAGSNPAVGAVMRRITAERAAEFAQAEAAAKPAPPVDPVQAKLTELKRVDDRFQAVGRLCDSVVLRLNTALKAGDRVAAYDAAIDGENACGGYDFQIPTEVSQAVPEPARSKLNADLQACHDGYTSLWSAMHWTKKVGNGDMRASTISAANHALSNGEAILANCRPTYEADIAAAGLARPGSSPSNSTQPTDHPQHG